MISRHFIPRHFIPITFHPAKFHVQIDEKNNVSSDFVKPDKKSNFSLVTFTINNSVLHKTLAELYYLHITYVPGQVQLLLF